MITKEQIEGIYEMRYSGEFANVLVDDLPRIADLKLLALVGKMLDGLSEDERRYLMHTNEVNPGSMPLSQGARGKLADALKLLGAGR
jgi:hypothetical protein